MKQVFLLVLSLLSIYSYAQIEKAATTSSTSKRIYIGVSTTHGIGYRILKQTRATTFPMGFPITERNNQEKPSYAFNAGINIGVKLNKFLAFETGLRYSQQGYKSEIKDLNFGAQWNGTTYVPLIGYAKSSSTYHYLDIPLGINISLDNKKVKPIINTGLVVNVLLNNTRKWEFKETENVTTGRDNNTSTYAAANLSAFLGIGIDYQINDLMSLRIMPVAQIQALQNVYNTPITERLYSAGINVALNFGIVDASSKKK